MVRGVASNICPKSIYKSHFNRAENPVEPTRVQFRLRQFARDCWATCLLYSMFHSYTVSCDQTMHHVLYTVQYQTRTLPSPFFSSEGIISVCTAQELYNVCTVYSCVLSPVCNVHLGQSDGKGSNPDWQDANQDRAPSLRPLW
jgi:hypothetical protein